MARVYNFSAGPAVLPEEVLREAADEMLDYKGSGQSVMEMSHRSKVYDNIIKEYYANDSIGVREINELKNDENKGKYLPNVENINLSSLKLNQDDYKNEIPNIISQIKEL